MHGAKQMSTVSNKTQEWNYDGTYVKDQPATHFQVDLKLTDPLSGPSKQCQKCGQRQATQVWIGEGGTLAFVHGQYQLWCDLCVVQVQLEYARESAKRIPELEKKLEELSKLEG